MAYIDRLSADTDVLIRNWWAVALRGVLGILLGLATFFRPGISFGVLVFAFAAYTFADGIFALVSALGGRTGGDSRWVMVLRGLAGLGVGIAMLFWPGITALALLYIIAAWALVGGVLEITAAIRLRKVIQHEWLLALGGVLAIALGVMLILSPAAGAIALTLWVGAYAFTFGIVLLVLGFRLRAWGRPESTGGPASHPAPSHP